MSFRDRGHEEHTFWCICCGKSGIPIQRRVGFQHERFHRKRLYCPWCRAEVNMVECKTYADVLEFKENFENGVFKEEAEESMAHCKNTMVSEKIKGDC